MTPFTPNGKITVFSDQIAMIALAGLLLIALVPMLVKRRKGTTGVDAMVPVGSANGLEAVCDYIRKEIAEPALHEHTDRFIKYIWSVFFFVLTVNILGLLPIPVVSKLFGTHLGGAATGNIWMTATLALITMAMMVVNGLGSAGSRTSRISAPVRSGWRRCWCPSKSSAWSRRYSRWPFDCSPT